MTGPTDILIIGGGLIGASLAYRLSSGGQRVTLLEANPEVAAPGTASWASAGIISPPARMDSPPGLIEMIKLSLELYPRLIERLPPGTGYRPLGQLSLAANPAEVRGLQKRQDWQDRVGFEARWLSPGEVAGLEPLAGPQAGALYNSAAIVDPARLTRLLARAAVEQGLRLLTGQSAAGLLWQGGEVAGVSLPNGTRLEAGRVVLAGGAWSGLWLDARLSESGLVPPGFGRMVWPVRGQMLALQPPPATALAHVLVGGHGYALPRPDGTISYGATVEPEAGFENGLTPAGLLELGRLVHKLTPSLDSAPVARTWSGLRPGSADELPLLGPLAELPGLWLATGHYRNGVLLAPATAELLAGALLAGQMAPLEPFRPTPARLARVG